MKNKCTFTVNNKRTKPIGLDYRPVMTNDRQSYCVRITSEAMIPPNTTAVVDVEFISDVILLPDTEYAIYEGPFIIGTIKLL